MYTIPEEAVKQLVDILNEIPYKYTTPIMKVLSENLRIIGEEKKEDE